MSDSSQRQHEPIQQGDLLHSNRPKPRLEELPDELLCSITANLNPADIASLSLSSTSLLRALGNWSWDRLRPAPGFSKQRHDFLCRIARDLKDQFACYWCGQLHALDRVSRPYIDERDDSRALDCVSRNPSPEPLKDIFDAHFRDSIYKLRFQHVQAVMAWWRNGQRYGLPSHTLGLTEVQRIVLQKFTISMLGDIAEEKIENCTVFTLNSIEPMIMNDELVLRVQQWRVHPPRSEEFQDFGDPHVCAHIDCYTYMPRLLQRCGRHPSANHQHQCQMCGQLLICRTCGVEFRLACISLGNLGTAVVVTKWINLGRGQSPSDVQWRIKIDNTGPTNTVNYKGDEKNGLASRFENRTFKPVKLRTRENELLLRRKLFYRTFQQSVNVPDTWFDYASAAFFRPHSLTHSLITKLSTQSCNSDTPRRHDF